MGDIDNSVMLTKPQAFVCFQNAEDIAQAHPRRNQLAKAPSVKPGYSVVAADPNSGVTALDASDLANLDALPRGKDANGAIVDPHDGLVEESEPDRPVRIGKSG